MRTWRNPRVRWITNNFYFKKVFAGIFILNEIYILLILNHWLTMKPKAYSIKTSLTRLEITFVKNFEIRPVCFETERQIEQKRKTQTLDWEPKEGKKREKLKASFGKTNPREENVNKTVILSFMAFPVADLTAMPSQTHWTLP